MVVPCRPCEGSSSASAKRTLNSSFDRTEDNGRLADRKGEPPPNRCAAILGDEGDDKKKTWEKVMEAVSVIEPMERAHCIQKSVPYLFTSVKAESLSADYTLLMCGAELYHAKAEGEHALHLTLWLCQFNGRTLRERK